MKYGIDAPCRSRAPNTETVSALTVMSTFHDLKHTPPLLGALSCYTTYSTAISEMCPVKQCGCNRSSRWWMFVTVAGPFREADRPHLPRYLYSARRDTEPGSTRKSAVFPGRSSAFETSFGARISASSSKHKALENIVKDWNHSARVRRRLEYLPTLECTIEYRKKSAQRHGGFSVSPITACHETRPQCV